MTVSESSFKSSFAIRMDFVNFGAEPYLISNPRNPTMKSRFGHAVSATTIIPSKLLSLPKMIG